MYDRRSKMKRDVQLKAVFFPRKRLLSVRHLSSFPGVRHTLVVIQFGWHQSLVAKYRFICSSNFISPKFQVDVWNISFYFITDHRRFLCLVAWITRGRWSNCQQCYSRQNSFLIWFSLHWETNNIKGGYSFTVMVRY